MKKIPVKIWLGSVLLTALLVAASAYFYSKYKQQQTDVILSSLGIKEVIYKLPLGTEAEITAQRQENELSLIINNLRINPSYPQDSEKIIAIFKNYTPYKDIYYYPKESLVIAGAEELNFSLQINVKYNKEAKNAFIYINISEPIIGEIKLSTKAENIGNEELSYFKNMLSKHNYDAIYQSIKLSFIDFTYIPALFMQNYQQAISFEQSSHPKKAEPFFLWYKKHQERLGLNTKKIADNILAMAKFLDNPQQIRGRISFAPPAPLMSVPSLIAAASLSSNE
ncbi:MAG: hypothetical protein IKD08_06215 [Alphaproteobacteria bacterium]|nr:hypothetical protein [Alphaproteobacteria bacterium]